MLAWRALLFQERAPSQPERFESTQPFSRLLTIASITTELVVMLATVGAALLARQHAPARSGANSGLQKEMAHNAAFRDSNRRTRSKEAKKAPQQPTDLTSAW